MSSHDGDQRVQQQTYERPDWACLLHSPPAKVGAWVRADQNYRTCSGCLDRLRESLNDVATRYRKLDATPGGTGDYGSRGAPGFASRAPASDQIVVMRDWRSKPHEVAYDRTDYVWDPEADNGFDPLPAGVHGPERAPGAYVERREVWVGGDGRSHQEPERPARSIPFTLASLANLVAEDREIKPPAGRDVGELVRWLDNQLDYVTRQEWIADFAEDIRKLVAQLRPVTGDKQHKVGECPNTIDEGERTRACGANLYAPLNGDTIRCGSCGRPWPRPQWEELGGLLKAS